MVKSKNFTSKHNNDLVYKLIFTTIILLVFRLGSFIPIPFIDSNALLEISSQSRHGALAMFNILSGGSLGRMSIFALAIMPYITSSIIIHFLSIAYKPLENIKKDGESGRKKINQITRYLTIFIATAEAYLVATKLENISASIGSVVMITGLFFKISTIVTLVVGTILLMWLGEQISCRGFGNGSSMIIFVGIVSGLPTSLINLFELSRIGTVSYFSSLLLITFTLLIIILIVFFEKSFRKIIINSSNQKSQKLHQNNYIPIKINSAGIIPTICANSILFIPASLYNHPNKFLESIFVNFTRGKPLFFILYIFLIYFFSFFYSSMNFNSVEISENLKKSSAFIPGKRPGSTTSEYFDFLMLRLTVIGATYLCFICVLPEFLMIRNTSFVLSGTSILICVNVVLDTLAQIRSYSINKRYDVLMKKIKFY